MALNTLKLNAEQYIEDGGWAKLDQLRKSYISVFKAEGRKSLAVRTKAARQKDRIMELEEALEVERRYRIRLQVAYESLLGRLRNIGKDDPEIAHFINRHVVGFSFKRLTIVGPSDDPNNG